MPLEKSVQEKVIKKVNEKKDEITSLLQSLVKIPSVTGDEYNVQKFISKTLSDMGLEVDLFEADVEKLRNNPDFFETTSFKKLGYKNRPNVVGTLKGVGGGKSLILNGHIDVVSPEPVSKWKHNPWGGEIEGGKLYGRGSADMKAGVAAMIMAVKCIMDLGLKPKGKVMINTVMEEEDGGVGGTLATILRGYTADGGIVTEPTHPNKMYLGNAGVRYFNIHVAGRTWHAAKAHAGVNAIGKAAKIYSALVELNENRQKRIRNPLYEYPALAGHEDREPGTMGRATTLNIGKMVSGDWPSTVAGWAVLEGRVGWPPPDTRENVMNEIEQTVAKVASQDQWLTEHPPKVEWVGWDARASQMSPDDPLPQMVKGYATQRGYGPVQMTAFPGGNDDRWFRRQGKMPCICYGPQGGSVHSIDEFCVIDSLPKTTEVLAMTILDWCGFQ